MTNLFLGGEALLLRILSLRLMNDAGVSLVRINIKVFEGLYLFVICFDVKDRVPVKSFAFVHFCRVHNKSDISSVNSDCIVAREYILS